MRANITPTCNLRVYDLCRKESIHISIVGDLKIHTHTHTHPFVLYPYARIAQRFTLCGFAVPTIPNTRGRSARRGNVVNVVNCVAYRHLCVYVYDYRAQVNIHSHTCSLVRAHSGMTACTYAHTNSHTHAAAALRRRIHTHSGSSYVKRRRRAIRPERAQRCVASPCDDIFSCTVTTELVGLVSSSCVVVFCVRLSWVATTLPTRTYIIKFPPNPSVVVASRRKTRSRVSALVCRASVLCSPEDYTAAPRTQ